MVVAGRIPFEGTFEFRAQSWRFIRIEKDDPTGEIDSVPTLYRSPAVALEISAGIDERKWKSL